MHSLLHFFFILPIPFCVHLLASIFILYSYTVRLFRELGWLVMGHICSRGVSIQTGLGFVVFLSQMGSCYFLFCNGSEFGGVLSVSFEPYVR